MRTESHIPAAIDVSFDVYDGEIFVIMGLSGSGKSTVVRCLSRLVDASSGEILLDSENLLTKNKKELTHIRRHKMGMVFQSFGLLPHLTVYENIAFPLKLQGLPARQLCDRVERVINLVGLEGREGSFPEHLSGGQQQRVGIARSLAVEPEIWFLDEPFSALDPLIRRQMQDEFLRIQRVLRKSIVFITHDFLEALRIADRMAIMRDGKIIQIGTPEDLILNPADDYIAQFTREVPRIKILRSGQCLDETKKNISGLVRVHDQTPLEILIPLMDQNPKGIAVHGEDGQDLGVVSPASIIRTLASNQRNSGLNAEELNG
ncbi:ATP-binding cassette domain-containing protein [Kiloniella antarctica]|uniref:ATP-binding cassette domain-containing protein n=1 Tax=Kiloniella antarctica TaxID=1550907 RepID=A0ABW5BK02_9PROT